MSYMSCLRKTLDPRCIPAFIFAPNDKTNRSVHEKCAVLSKITIMNLKNTIHLHTDDRIHMIRGFFTLCYIMVNARYKKCG